MIANSQAILLSAPDVGLLEQEYVIAALRSGWVAPLGPDVDLFEPEVAARAGVPHAVAVNSGTAALHLALRVPHGEHPRSSPRPRGRGSRRPRRDRTRTGCWICSSASSC